jgi:hypothetical protein
MRYFVTARSAAFCTLGIVLGLLGLVYLTHLAAALPSFLPGPVEHARHPRIYFELAIPLLALAGLALYAANRISKDALGDW